MTKKSYLGGSTIIHSGSSWFGRGDYNPGEWEKDCASKKVEDEFPFEKITSEQKDTFVLISRDELIKAQRQRVALKKKLKGTKHKKKKSKDERLASKYKNAEAILFKKVPT